jgi:hypothetical protein
MSKVGQSSSQPHIKTVRRERDGDTSGTDGTTRMHITHSEETFKINEKEYNWGPDYVRELGR